jgi:predicted nucleotidyltransferase
MMKRSPLPPAVLERLPEAGRYLTRQRKVEFAYLFGGLARHRQTATSDIDIAVYLTPKADPTRTRLEILQSLTGIFKTDEIDLVVLNTAPLSLRGRIQRQRLTIADRNPFLRHRYESLTMREFFDFSFRERAILEGRYLHGR